MIRRERAARSRDLSPVPRASAGTSPPCGSARTRLMNRSPSLVVSLSTTSGRTAWSELSPARAVMAMLTRAPE